MARDALTAERNLSIGGIAARSARKSKGGGGDIEIAQTGHAIAAKREVRRYQRVTAQKVARAFIENLRRAHTHLAAKREAALIVRAQVRLRVDVDHTHAVDAVVVELPLQGARVEAGVEIRDDQRLGLQPVRANAQTVAQNARTIHGDIAIQTDIGEQLSGGCIEPGNPGCRGVDRNQDAVRLDRCRPFGRQALHHDIVEAKRRGVQLVRDSGGAKIAVQHEIGTNAAAAEVFCQRRRLIQQKIEGEIVKGILAQIDQPVSGEGEIVGRNGACQIIAAIVHFGGHIDPRDRRQQRLGGPGRQQAGIGFAAHAESAVARRQIDGGEPIRTKIGEQLSVPTLPVASAFQLRANGLVQIGKTVHQTVGWRIEIEIDRKAVLLGRRIQLHLDHVTTGKTLLSQRLGVQHELGHLVLDGHAASQ